MTKMWDKRCCYSSKFILFLIIFLLECLLISSGLFWFQRSFGSKRTMNRIGNQEYLQSRSITIQRNNTVSLEKGDYLTTFSNNCSKQIAFIAPNMDVFGYMPPLRKLFLIGENGIPQVRTTCNEQRCNLTIGVVWTQKDFLKNSDVIMLHYLYAGNLNHALTELSAVGRDNATVIIYNRESPLVGPKSIADAFYDIDINYHSRASVRFPYGYYDASKPTDEVVPANNWAKNKTHLVAWMASNCNDIFWPRKEFIQDLRNYIPIDSYGGCGNLSCSRSKMDECRNMLKKYKFYLALENSECDDYITEKFWNNALKHGIVPVVYGGRREAYEKLAPPNSFIHVTDFSSTKELANYLLELDKNDTKYNEYFYWRLKGRVEIVQHNLGTFCEAIPLLSSKTLDKRKVSESEYFNSCRMSSPAAGSFTGPRYNYGSYNNWKPWK